MTLYQNFQKVAESHGNYFPEKKELNVRTGRKMCRFICENGKIRIKVPGAEEVVDYVAPDASVQELQRLIAYYCIHC